MTPLCTFLLATLAAAPPLAGAPAGAPTAAAAPAGAWEELSPLHGRRLRFGFGASYSHLLLAAPGGNALGGGTSLVLEGRRLEVALSLYAQGGFAAGDRRARHSGPATSYLRATARIAPFPAWLRVLLEAGGQVGYDRAWSWCAAGSRGDRCAAVPGRVSYAGVAGLVVLLRAAGLHLALGLDALVHGRGTPEVCAEGVCEAPPIGRGRFGLQTWVETGFGGLHW